MSTLTDQIKNDDAQARKQNLARYSEILHRADDPQPGDAAALQELLKTLDVTVKEFEKDAAAIKTAKGHADTIATAQAEISERLSPEAKEQREQRIARIIELEAEARELRRQHDNDHGRLGLMQRIAGETRGDLHRLRERRPRAFGQEPAAPAGPQIGQMRKQRELGHG